MVLCQSTQTVHCWFTFKMLYLDMLLHTDRMFYVLCLGYFLGVSLGLPVSV